MFKKRDKAPTLLKRTHEDRYLDESEAIRDQANLKRQKIEHESHSHNGKPCSGHVERQNVASTKDHLHYKQEYIASEVSELSSLKTTVPAAKVDDATKQLEIDTAYENDALAHARQNIEISKGIKEGRLDPNVYRGLHGYQNYFEQTEEDLRLKKFSGTLGPVRAPTFIRNTTRVDYNPERCKDYYETGRCNFGDSCVFIHDRSDYKSGWQLDQEFQAEQKRKQLKLMGHEVDDEEENYEIHSESAEGEGGLPFKCRICEEAFTTPVVTQCGHYFCERCALQYYAKSGDCQQCGKPTNGIFNEATKLLAKMKELEKAAVGKEESGDEADEEAATTVAATKVEQGSDSEDGEGVLSKKDLAVFKEYKDRAKEANAKKYQPQSGWFIP